MDNNQLRLCAKSYSKLHGLNTKYIRIYLKKLDNVPRYSMNCELSIFMNHRNAAFISRHVYSVPYVAFL